MKTYTPSYFFCFSAIYGQETLFIRFYHFDEFYFEM